MSTGPIETPQVEKKLSWNFPPTFWFANGAELCERAAFYGMFITLYRYLNVAIGFTDVETGWITGAFASILYFLPTFMGIMADKIGFKRSLILAFALLAGGYALLGAFQVKLTAVLALTLIMFGGAIIKPVISGTVAKCSDDNHRARAMSIFYMVVNIGSFTGKTVAAPLNEHLGLQYINFYAAAMSFAALILIALFYRNPDTEGTGKTLAEAIYGLKTVIRNFRFLSLILIIGGFWAIQGQLYASMPTYIERLLGQGYKPEWLANINPLVVVLCVVPITHAVRNFKPSNAIGIGLLIIPFTAMIVALGPILEGVTGDQISLGVAALHPIVLVFVIGIGIQGLAECFLSPKWLEYVSKQAPKDEVGLYLGYSHLTTFFAWAFGFVLAGYLLEGYCPDPKTFTPEVRDQWRAATDAKYRFVLTDDAVVLLEDDTPLPAGIREAFTTHEIELPADATMHLEESKDRWGTEKTERWQIDTDAGAYVIERVEYELEEPTPTGEDTLVEYTVSAPTERPRDDMAKLPAAYDRAHYIWWVFAGVGFLAFAAMMVFKVVTDRIDRARPATANG